MWRNRSAPDPLYSCNVHTLAFMWRQLPFLRSFLSRFIGQFAFSVAIRRSKNSGNFPFQCKPRIWNAWNWAWKRDDFHGIHFMLCHFIDVLPWACVCVRCSWREFGHDVHDPEQWSVRRNYSGTRLVQFPCRVERHSAQIIFDTFSTKFATNRWPGALFRCTQSVVCLALQSLRSLTFPFSTHIFADWFFLCRNDVVTHRAQTYASLVIVSTENIHVFDVGWISLRSSAWSLSRNYFGQKVSHEFEWLVNGY